MFAQALATTAHLSSGGLSKMVYEHLSGCFIPKDPSLTFSKLFQVVNIAHGDIPKLVALVLGVNRFLAMAKDTSGLCPIVMGEMFLRFINRSIIL
jgi:hypothetical protein